MDQIKTGKFIAQVRKERKLTQKQLAEQMNISDKTVSKWERGGGFPEVSLIQPLCEVLQINVNELFSGERLTDADYRRKAEDNMMELMKEREESKKKLILATVVAVITILAGCTLVMVAGLLDMTTMLRIVLIVIAVVVMAGGIAVAAVLEMDSGAYECRHCHTRFRPTAKAYIAGWHTLTTRYLECPECGKKSLCRRRLNH